MSTVQVETFECQETAAEPIEASQEAIALCESLELEGQLALCRKGDKPSDAKRMPYREITAEERFVYQTLCPTEIPLERYKAAPIPLRVLQVAAHVKALGFCKRLEVWDKETDQVRDPVLVGHAHDRYEYNADKIHTYILARWGDVLETFSTLLKQAMVIKREQLTQKAQAVLAKVEHATDAELRTFNETVS